MSEPRKLAIIGYCAQCPDYIYFRTRLSGACGKTHQPIPFVFGPIPEWCPLPDAPNSASIHALNDANSASRGEK